MNILVIILIILILVHVGLEDVMQEIKSWFRKDDKN